MYTLRSGDFFFLVIFLASLIHESSVAAHASNLAVEELFTRLSVVAFLRGDLDPGRGLHRGPEGEKGKEKRERGVGRKCEDRVSVW